MKENRTCLNCNKGRAQYISPYGWVSCRSCQKRQKQYTVRETIETIPEELKEQRKEYATDVLQRYRGHVANSRYIKKYGSEGFTEEEIKNAQDVFPEYYKDE